MNENRKKKVKVVTALKSAVNKSVALVVFRYQGLSVPQIQSLRKKLTDLNTTLKVYKNRLMKVAVGSTKYEELNSYLSGPNAFAFVNEDNGPKVLKTIAQVGKVNKLVEFVSAIWEKQVLGSQELVDLSVLPTKEEALTIFAKQLLSPVHYVAAALFTYCEDSPVSDSNYLKGGENG